MRYNVGVRYGHVICSSSKSSTNQTTIQFFSSKQSCKLIILRPKQTIEKKHDFIVAQNPSAICVIKEVITVIKKKSIVKIKPGIGSTANIQSV